MNDTTPLAPTTSTLSRRHRWQNLIAATACVTVFGFALGEMFPLLSLIMEREGVSPEVIGINSAMQPIGILFAGFVIPPAVRAFGARPVVLAAAVLAALIVLTYPFAPIFWGWFGLRVLHGLAVATLFSISEAWVVQYADGAYRGRIVAIYGSVLAVSFGLGPTVIYLAGTEGILAFVIGSCVLLAATVPIFFVRIERPSEEEDHAASFFTFAPKAPVLLAAVGVFAVFDAACLGFLPVYGVKKGLGEETAAILISALAFGNVLLQPPIGWLADLYPKRTIMAICAVLTAVFSMILPETVGTVWMWVVLVIIGATSVGIYTVALAELGERFQGADLVAGTAAMSTMWGGGALVGALLTGWVFEAFGPDAFPRALSIVLASFLVVMALRARAKRRRAMA
ncbi:MAG: MFS transporter [Hyphomicrobiaceae bacterium]